MSFWRGDDCSFVVDVDPEMTDQEIWRLAQSKQFTIMTKDADFTARVFMEPDGPHVIHFRLGNLKISAFHTFLSSNWPTICDRSARYQLVEVYEDHIDCFE